MSGAAGGAGLFSGWRDRVFLGGEPAVTPMGGKSNSILPYIPTHIFVSLNIVGR